MNLRTLSLATALIACSAAVEAQQKIPVGLLVDFSGPTSDVGVPYGQGVADAIAYINKNGGVAQRLIAGEQIDYSYQVPRAIATYKKWTSQDGVAAIQGWGTADTEALIAFLAKDKVPYFSGSYSGNLTDPTGKASRSARAAPFNFFYGPSYSDAARAMIQWAADDWKRRGKSGKPKYVHMGANHPYPNAPKAAGEEYAKELGFDVLPTIQFALTPGDYTAQCLSLKEAGADYAYLGNTGGSNISVLKSCHTVGVQVQFLANVWGMDENAMKASGQAANGVVFPIRTARIWPDRNEAEMKTVRDVSAMSDATGQVYRAAHYIAGICSAFYMKEAIDWAARNGGVNGDNIRLGMYQKKDWVPEGLSGVCQPSTWTAEDHRGTTKVSIRQARISGATDAGLNELIANGTLKIEQIAVIDVPRKPEWLGW